MNSLATALVAFVSISSVIFISNPKVFSEALSSVPKIRIEFPSSPSPYPTPNMTPIPSTSPSPAPTTKTVSGKNSNTTAKPSNNVECIGPDGVHFKTTQKECDDFNAAWKNNPKTAPSQQATTGSPSNTYQPSKINCSFSGSGFQYDFGVITYSECAAKTDAYWSEQQANANSKSIITTPTPTSSVGKSQEQIEACKTLARQEEYECEIGCDQRYGRDSDISTICKKECYSGYATKSAGCE